MSKVFHISMSLWVMLFWWTSTNMAQTSKQFVLEALEGLESDRQPQRGERWALIVGVNKYDDPEINSLRYAVADAKALYDLLTDPDKGRFSSDKVKLLTTNATDKRLRPTKANILHYLKEWLAPNVKAEDTVLIFFSGHGTVYNDRKYLLPVDTDTFYTPAYAIDNQEFIDGIDSLKAEKVITLLDSCHSGGVSRSGKGIGDLLSDDFYSEFEKATGRVTLASCSGNEQSFEWDEKRQGVFTYYLLEGLNGAANTQRDQAITFDEIAEYVGNNVRKWAQENKNGKQNPRKHIEDQSADGKIAVTFDVVASYEIALERMKEKLRGYIGTGPDQLSAREISDAIKVLEQIATQISQKSISRNEDSALTVIASLVKGEITVADYKGFSSLIQDALKPEIQARPSPGLYGEVKILKKATWAELYLDGKLVAQSPKVLRVEAGKHTLTLKRTGYKEITKAIEVIPNQTIIIDEELEKENDE